MDRAAQVTVRCPLPTRDLNPEAEIREHQIGLRLTRLTELKPHAALR